MSTPMRVEVTHVSKFETPDFGQFLKDNEITVTDEEFRSLKAGNSVAVIGRDGSLFRFAVPR